MLVYVDTDLQSEASTGGTTFNTQGASLTVSTTTPGLQFEGALESVTMTAGLQPPLSPTINKATPQVGRRATQLQSLQTIPPSMQVVCM